MSTINEESEEKSEEEDIADQEGKEGVKIKDTRLQKNRVRAKVVLKSTSAR